MLQSLRLKNFTVFNEANFIFNNLNVIVGENGSGKSHLLKLTYAAIAVSAQRANNLSPDPPTKSFYEKAIADKLISVFRPDALGHLASNRASGNTRCEVDYHFDESEFDLSYIFSTLSKTTVEIIKNPAAWTDKWPVYLPTRELLTIFPSFVSLYETSYTEFDETWRDTCLLLGKKPNRGPRDAKIKRLLELLERAMGGKVEIDNAGRFYLNQETRKIEAHLIAEGLNKLAMLAHLIVTNSLLDKGYLFWDEPEANLNPKLIKTIAKSILLIAESGVQVFIATHSLFLLRELHILTKQEFPELMTRCFGLHLEDKGAVSVTQGETMDDVGDIAALDEDLLQSERYMDTEMGLSLSSS